MQIVKQIDSESKRFWRKAYPNHLVIILDPVRIQCNEFQLEIRDNKMYYYTPEDREDSEIGTIAAGDIAEGGTYRFSRGRDDHTEPCHSNCECYELHITALVLHISWDMVQVWEEWDDDIPAAWGLVSPVVVARLLKELDLPALPWQSKQRACERIAEYEEKVAQNYICWPMTK